MFHSLFYDRWVFHCLCATDLLYSFSTWWTMGCFQISAMVNNAEMNIGSVYLFKLMWFFCVFCCLLFSDICPGVKLLNDIVALFLFSVLENSILFSTAAAPIYVFTNSVWASPILHILSNMCSLWAFWWQSFWQVWGSFDLHFPDV